MCKKKKGIFVWRAVLSVCSEVCRCQWPIIHWQPGAGVGTHEQTYNTHIHTHIHTKAQRECVCVSERDRERDKKGLGFMIRVQGLGFRNWGLGFGV